MCQAIEDRDAKAFQRAAHTLKSNTATFGTESLSELCEELEIMGQAGTIKNTLEEVIQLAEVYRRVKVVLEKQKARG